jgi:AraC family transcriptional regulator
MNEVVRWNSYAEFMAKSDYAQFPQEHRRSAGCHSIEMIMVDQLSCRRSDPSVAEAILVLPLRADEGCPWAWDMGSGWRRDVSAPGRMLVLPPDLESRWEVGGQRSVLALIIPTKTIRNILGPICPSQLSNALLPLAEATWEDALLNQLMVALWEACEHPSPIGNLMADGITTAAVTRLFQKSGVGQGLDIKPVSLAPWRMKRVKHFSLANLHKHIDMLDLAGAAGLSNRHFTRAFREETGQTPHRWLVQQRLERARQLLMQSDLSLTAVAESCGFADQNHMIKIFKQATGLTPFRWKQVHRSDPE